MAVQQMAVRERFAGTLRIPTTEPLPRSPVPAVKRRRRIVLALSAGTFAALLAAVASGVPAAWWAVAAVLVAGCCYLCSLHHVRRSKVEREFAALLRDPHPDPFEYHAPTAAGLRSVDSPGQSQTWALVRFMFANVAGWALSPLVFALTLLLRDTPRDATGQRWLANLHHAQERLRDQSMRAVAISAATTASVAAAGTVAGVTGAGGASAATLPAGLTVPATVGIADAGTGSTTYVVVAGDTLGAIAARFGTTVAALAALNHIADPNLIYAGQVLTISGGGAAPQPQPSWGPAAGATYTVVAGDTLGAIAARFGTTVAALAALNHIADPNLIYAGEVIALTGSGGGNAPAPAPTPSAPTSSSGTTYTVVAGDTLGAIAARFGTTVAALAALNHIANPNLIYAGEVLLISGTAAPAPAAPAPAPAPAPAAPSSAAAIAVRVALEQVGKPYQWAGAGPNSFDCSGLVMYAWAQAGVSLPHYSVAQYEDTTRISASQLEPGDLVFTDNGEGAQPGHVTMYIGNGQIITADSPGTVIRVETLDWDGIPIGYGRVP